MDQASVRTNKKPIDPKIFGAIILLFVGGLFVLLRNDSPVEKSQEKPEQQEATSLEIPEGYERRSIDGVAVQKEELPEKLFGVMIENSSEAWPLSGLAQARLVIEAPVEGNIPRFLVFFDDTQRVDQIGPVRSARPYYIRWAQGFHAMYTHVGGSPEGLSILRTTGIPQLNEFFWGKFFWRADYRYAPHNVYTSVENLIAAFEERAFEQEPIPMWEYSEAIPSGGQKILSVRVPFSSLSSVYTAKWEYDSDSESFVRYQGKNKQEDGSGEEVFAKNVVVLFTAVTTIDNEGRKSLTTIGSGRALIFRDGFVYEAEWKKEEYTSPLEFYLSDNEKVQFKPGTTWIEAIPLSTEVDIISAD